MRSYDQLCPVAVALDVVGDRWTLLLLRDLLWHGPMRFGEIDDRNPNLSTSLLTSRLRDLERAGLVERVGADSATHYRLTEPGQRIRGVIDAFYEFGAPLLSRVPLSTEMLDYLVRSTARHCRRQLLDLDRSMSVHLDIDGCQATLVVGPGQLGAVSDGDVDVDVDGALRCSQAAFVALLAGQLELDGARHDGAVAVVGDAEAVRLVVDLLASSTAVAG